MNVVLSAPQLSMTAVVDQDSTQLPPLSPQSVLQLPCAKALYNYDGKEPGDLRFSKGDLIILRRQVDENWYHGELGGVHGFFPTNFVQVIKPLPLPPPQCKALYDFELKDKEADKDCLPFSKVGRPPPFLPPSPVSRGSPRYTVFTQYKHKKSVLVQESADPALSLSRVLNRTAPRALPV